MERVSYWGFDINSNRSLSPCLACLKTDVACAGKSFVPVEHVGCTSTGANPAHYRTDNYQRASLELTHLGLSESELVSKPRLFGKVR